ncbi:uncharacterized protein TRAVEDRAFT_73252 [Trametes versicolor FP-101664 SS1]|uniref:uncharacterized protein n=1 Tax=Trametes versicolor (strain FP-101664) TaxID=717944 RepID=UPI0004622C77|nr:uncharacterized protein TRAVEDRAFT_73252 [Trametes versicolor FP-101664 SS1]EIW56896.1 hypothetical protein TRAVEDRAFT_73252 [Trametes versicolor FP-101664 SS1]
MSQPTSRNKRQRTNSDAPESENDVPNPIKQDDEFWFEDGNIVLIARDVEFRVYKGILAKHSPVFADMFSLPPVPAQVHPVSARDITPTADTCPVVHLCESPEDLRHVLRMCMSDTSLSSSPLSAGTPSFHMISAVIRIAHKYEMAEMLAQAVKFLKQRFPTSFRAYEKLSVTARVQMNPIGVVNLARLIDEPSLLPTAFLDCCLLASSELLRGYKHEDGSVETLTQEDLLRCLNAREELAKYTLIIVTSVFLPSVSDACADPTDCAEVLMDMLSDVRDHGDRLARPELAISFLTPYKNYIPRCCSSCQEMLRVRDRDERYEVWNELPEMMNVASNIKCWE